MASAANVSLSLGDAANPAVLLTQGSGSLRIDSTGLTATISGNVAVNVPNVSVSGTFGLTINTTSAPVTLTPPSPAPAVTVPAGPFVRVSGTGVNITIAGQTLTGNFAIERATLADGTAVTRIAASNVSVDLLGNGTPGSGVVSVANAHGVLVIANGALSGKVSGDVAIAPLSYSGKDFTVEFNTGKTAVKQSIDVNGETFALDLPAGPFFRIDPTVSLTLGGQTFSGQFSCSRSSRRTG